MLVSQVVKVHLDDPPQEYYTIVLNHGTEKQTTADSLFIETSSDSFSIYVTSVFSDISSAVKLFFVTETFIRSLSQVPNQSRRCPISAALD